VQKRNLGGFMNLRFFSVLVILSVVSTTALAECGTWEIRSPGTNVLAKIHPSLQNAVQDLARSYSSLKPVEESVLAQVANGKTVSAEQSNWLKILREDIAIKTKELNASINLLESAELRAQQRDLAEKSAKILSNSIYFDGSRGC
jgi:hypothetical protein